MSINHLHPPFDKKEARQALLWGIKQTDYLAAMAGDAKRYQACAAVFGCGEPASRALGAEPLAGSIPRSQGHADRRPAATAGRWS